MIAVGTDIVALFSRARKKVKASLKGSALMINGFLTSISARFFGNILLLEIPFKCPFQFD
jgi:hypothetical protein